MRRVRWPAGGEACREIYGGRRLADASFLVGDRDGFHFWKVCETSRSKNIVQHEWSRAERKIADGCGRLAGDELARALCDAGRVLSAHYAPPVLKGVVQDAGAEFRSGLKIVTRTNVENICGCRASREWGTICAHSLAVGLKVLRPKLARAGEPEVSPPRILAATAGPFFSTTEAGEPIRLRVILSPNFQAAWEKDQVMVGAEVEQSGGRILIHALAAAKTFRASPEIYG